MLYKRFIYFIILILTVITGLCSRRYGVYLPPFIAEYAGDTLWAAMVYWGICLFFPSVKVYKAILFALLFSYAIEISQLYQADWINAVRANRIGALVLGHGFLWSDMVCYSVGVLLAALIDWAFIIRMEQKHSKWV